MIPARGPQTKFLGTMHLEIIVGDHWLPALVASEVPERQFFWLLMLPGGADATRLATGNPGIQG